MMKKSIVIILVCMLLMVGIIIPVSGTTLSDKTSTSLTTGNILYVGGSGPNNYTKIQDAIDNASDGDTVFVYNDSSPYLENIIVNTSIQLIGEDKQTTVIDGGGKDNVIYVSANDVSIIGFSILGRKKLLVPQWYTGIYVEQVTRCTIRDNIVQNNQWIGIRLKRSSTCVVTDNRVIGNGYGIGVEYSSDNNVTGNLIMESMWGIGVGVAENTIIQGNNISSNNIGVYAIASSDTQVLKNNFLKNIIDATFSTDTVFLSQQKTIWQGNYWDQKLVSFKPIFGKIVFIPWINFDRYPAQEPYDI